MGVLKAGRGSSLDKRQKRQADRDKGSLGALAMHREVTEIPAGVLGW